MLDLFFHETAGMFRHLCSKTRGVPKLVQGQPPRVLGGAAEERVEWHAWNVGRSKATWTSPQVLLGPGRLPVSHAGSVEGELLEVPPPPSCSCLSSC